MEFNDLKIQISKAHGKCSRSKEGTTFHVRNGKLEFPPDEGICIFALGSLLQPISSAVVPTADGNSILDILDEFQCPEPHSGVTFKLEIECKA